MYIKHCYLRTGLHEATSNYAEKKKEGRSPEITMLKLAWEVEDFQLTNEEYELKNKTE